MNGATISCQLGVLVISDTLGMKAGDMSVLCQLQHAARMLATIPKMAAGMAHCQLGVVRGTSVPHGVLGRQADKATPEASTKAW